MSFKRFESLLAEIGSAFVALKEKFPKEVCCKPGCIDCCSAFFNVSFVEAEYVRVGLKGLSSATVAEVKERADNARLQTVELINNRTAEEGQDAELEVGSWRVRCPMLSEEGRCVIYEHRPVTCRAYGLPTSIGDKGHVCGFSAFDKGLTYPTIKLDQINEYLLALSGELAAGMSMPAAEAQKRLYLYEVILGDGEKSK